MRKNRILACAVAAALAVTGMELPGGNWTAAVVEAAETGDHFTYGDFKCTYLEDGTIEISDYNGSDTEVVIPEKINGAAVTSIGDNAFWGCSLTSIEIPNSVTSIGKDAFSGCGSLMSIIVESGNGNYSSEDGVLYNTDKTELICCPIEKTGVVQIPDGVTSIGEWAFRNCGSLTGVEIPDSVTSIGKGAFSGCSRLTGVEIPDGVTSIGEWAFYCCFRLTSIEIPEGVMSIGDYAFYRCSDVISIKIPNSVTSIGSSAFYECSSLTSIEIPDSVTSIGEYAFSDCSSLTSVTIPESVIYIGDHAFEGCSSLTSVIIPETVIEIGISAFLNCDNLTIYGYSGTAAETYASENGFAFIVLDAVTVGDVDQNGVIDYFDAITVLQYDAELLSLSDNQLLAGDVNGDGAVDSFDAVKILQYDAELIESFE